MYELGVVQLHSVLFKTTQQVYATVFLHLQQQQQQQ